MPLEQSVPGQVRACRGSCRSTISDVFQESRMPYALRRRRFSIPDCCTAKGIVESRICAVTSRQSNSGAGKVHLVSMTNWENLKLGVQIIVVSTVHIF